MFNLKKIEGKKPKGYKGPTQYTITPEGSLRYFYGTEKVKIKKKNRRKH